MLILCYTRINDDDLIKSHQSDNTVKSSRCTEKRAIAWSEQANRFFILFFVFIRALRGCNKVQRRRWNVYEVVNDHFTAFFRYAPALNLATFLAEILISFPV